MALELGVASTALSGGFPAAVVELIREVLPKWAYALVDPSSVYLGEHAGRGAPDPLPRMKLKAKCRDVDCVHALKTGQKKLAKDLAEEMIEIVRTTSEFKSLAVAWSDAPNVERTVRRWRREYAADLEEAISSRPIAPDRGDGIMGIEYDAEVARMKRFDDEQRFALDAHARRELELSKQVARRERKRLGRAHNS